MYFHVPTVDITPYVTGGTAEERAAVAAAIDKACTEVGFIQIIGHGVPASAIDGLKSAMDEFFALELEAKKQYRVPTNRGYSPPKSESLSLSLGVEAATRMNDFFEAFNIGNAASEFPGLDLPDADYSENVWPTEVPTFERATTAYFAEASRVALTMREIFADALGLAPGFFAQYTDHSLNVMRMNNYALPPGTVELDGELTGMGEHTDYGIVTILWADQVRGLQVLGTDGSWNDVSPADDALLINLGDVTGRWTNERWMSTLHRVKPPIVGGTIERRRSAAFFLDGNIDALIETLPVTIDDEHPNLYTPVTVGEHLRAKLAGSRAGVRNEAAEREGARVLSAQG